MIAKSIFCARWEAMPLKRSIIIVHIGHGSVWFLPYIEVINDERPFPRRAEQLTQADWPNGIAGVQDLLSAIDDLEGVVPVRGVPA
jgi:hypothetical protein